MECKEVKAVVSIGCCYNLLSEEVCESSSSQCGFPMSNGIKSAGLSLGKSSRDLACQVQFYLAFLIISSVCNEGLQRYSLIQVYVNILHITKNYKQNAVPSLIFICWIMDLKEG